MIRLVVILVMLAAGAPAGADEPTLRPDPPARVVKWPAVLPAVVLQSRPYPAVLHAEHAGPFALTTSMPEKGKETTRTVFDLRTGKKVGQWKSEFGGTTQHSLSSDGKHYVALIYPVAPMPGAAPRQPRRTLAAFDTATGKQLWTVELTSFANRVLFVGTDRVFIDRGNQRDNRPELYDLKTGKLVLTFPPGPLSTNHVAVSPGGAFMVKTIERNQAVPVVSTNDGSLVKRIELPASDPNRPSHVQEVSFSPDGARLAVVLLGMSRNSPNERRYRVLSWDLATGEQDADALMPPVSATRTPMLRWSADGKAWFITGVGMVDPDTGAVYWRRKFDPKVATDYLPISADRLISFDWNGTAREIALPKERIAAALKAIRTGGLAVDGWLPTLVKADRTAARAVTVPDRAEDWTYQPDPAPATKTSKPLRVPVPARQIESAQVVGPSAVFELGVSSPDLDSPWRLVRIDLATGKPTGQVELPHVVRLADVAPDGETAITVDAEDTRRVDVWNLGTGQHVAGWRLAGAREPGGEVLHAALLSADRVLTLTRGGELAVWSLPGVKAVYVARVSGLGIPARSPGRKYLFAFQQNVIRVIEAATGQLAGDLPADTTPLPTMFPALGPWSPSPLVVRPDGKEATAVFRSANSPGMQMRRWDLATAKLEGRYALTAPVQTPTGSLIRYAGPDHLLLSDSDLLGQATRLIEWKYVRPEATRIASSADGRYWYATGDFTPAAAAVTGAAPATAAPFAVLVAVELPHPVALAAMKAAADNSADNLLGPGKTVGLKLDLADPPDTLKESVTATLSETLKARGLKVTDGKSDVVLTAKAHIVPDGPNVTVRALRPGEQGAGTATKVELPYLATQLSLSADGQTIWSGGERQSPPHFRSQPYRLPAKDTDLKAWLRERAWDRVSETWQKLTLPPTLIRTPGGLVTLPGTSEFGPDGLRPPRTGRP